MDQLPALGTAIAQIVRPTHQIYGALLQKNATNIKSTSRKTHSYGSDPRQCLDVYHPSSNPSGTGAPILVFLYGGGLVNGAKIVPAVENELAYANLGHFFADTCGFVVVIIDYRLVPQARFPSGGEDLALAVEWIRLNLREPTGTKDLFIMGNSAGGIHLSTYLFSPVFAETRKSVLSEDIDSGLRLRGAILLSVPVHFQAADPSRAGVLEKYYGDRVEEDCPYGLLKALDKQSSVAESLPGVQFLSLLGTLDPEDEILLPNRDFAEAWKAGETTSTSNLRTETMEGQNHISPCFSIGTGIPKEEEWGHQMAKFCSSVLSQ